MRVEMTSKIENCLKFMIEFSKIAEELNGLAVGELLGLLRTWLH